MKAPALLFAVAFLAGLTSCTSDDNSARPVDPTADAIAKAQVVVTFFREEEPCDTTKRVEQMCRNAVAAGFGSELNSGEVVYRVICAMLPENDHYLDDYEIGEKALIVARQENGKECEFVACHDIWILFEEETSEFDAYVQQQIRDYLAKG